MSYDDQGLQRLPECDIRLTEEFLDPQEAWNIYNTLLEETPWRQDNVKVFGKIYAQPRLTALYDIHGKSYTYSGLTLNPHPFTPLLNDLRKRVAKAASAEFSTCLLNLYRDGNDSNGWHADNEAALGTNPVIASLSLGATRQFKLKHREDKDLRASVALTHGSLLLMQGETQHRWLHQIPKTRRMVDPRINLTFRRLY